ncbi:MAG: prepilin-type N-terminal cleavage/methylation domain-containing protein [Pseudomonadota bacterium]
MKEKRNLKGGQGGFTLIEITVVLVIIAILIKAVAILAGSSIDKANMDAVGKFVQLTKITVKEDAKFNGGNYTGLTEPVLANLTIMKGYRAGSGATASLVVNDSLPIDIAISTTLIADDTIDYTINGGLTNEQCKEVVQKTWGLYDALDLNGANVKANSTVAYNAAKAAAVQTSCESTADNNVMKWSVKG